MCCFLDLLQMKVHMQYFQDIHVQRFEESSLNAHFGMKTCKSWKERYRNRKTGSVGKFEDARTQKLTRQERQT